MSTKLLSFPYEIELLKTDKPLKIVQSRNYFELVYTFEGSGKQLLKEQLKCYKKGYLSIFTPLDSPIFEPQEESFFMLIRFTGNYMNFNKENLETCCIFKKIENRLLNYDRSQGCITSNVDDKNLLHALMQKILSENKNINFFSDIMIKNALTIVLSMIAQSLEKFELLQLEKSTEDGKIFRILQYIQNNIYENNKLNLSHLSNVFHFSVNYFGEYFKTQTGQNVKEYILNYKINLAEKRIQQHMPTLAIVEELGFTDESHFSRILKKYKGYSIKDFKNQMAAY